MADISYDYYRIFYFVGRYKSFSMAAKLLGSNQPNVTKLMNKLEQQLGCTLFVRSNRGVELTSEGSLLYGRVSVAYEQIRQAESELERDTGMAAGSVSIGENETALRGIMLDVLRDYHRKYPKVHIQLLNYSTPRAVQALQQGAVDLCVVTTPVEIPKGFRITKIREYREILVAGAGYADEGKALTIDMLDRLPLVSLVEGTGTHAFYTRLFAKYGKRFHPDIQAATSDQLLPLIENNLGVGFVPEFMVRRALEDARIRRLPLQSRIPAREICLVEDEGRSLGAAGRVLKEEIMSYHEPEKDDLKKPEHANG